MSNMIANTHVALPKPEKIPTPAARAAYEKALDIANKRRKASNELSHASDELHRLTRDEPTRRGRAIASGESEGESPVAAAEQVVAELQASVEALIVAEGIVLGELVAAVRADGDAWSAILLASAEKALLKLTTGLRMATEGRDEVLENLGMLGMHRRLAVGESYKLAPFHPRGSSQFDLNAGIDALRSGLSDATRELERLRPREDGKKGKQGKGKKVDQ